MVLPFEFNGLDNIVDGSELVPDWLSGAGSREEARKTLRTLCHRFEIEGAMILTCESQDNHSEWSVSFSSFSSPEYETIGKIPDVRNVLSESLSASTVGLVSAELQLSVGDKHLLFVQVEEKYGLQAAFVFVSKQTIKFPKLAELKLTSEVLWKLMCGSGVVAVNDNMPSQKCSGIEGQVVEFRRRGLSSGQISERLGLSPHTVFHLMQHVRKKYHLN